MNIIQRKIRIRISRYFLAIIIAVLLIFGGLLYYIYRPFNIATPEAKPAARNMNKILESLSAPLTPSNLLPQKVLNSVSAPKKEKEPSKDILKNLTAPE